MPQQIFAIHGGTAFDSYQDFLASLELRKISLESLQFIGWRSALQNELGTPYEVFTPQMPNAQNAKYLEWKIWFAKMIPLMHDGVILIGHSLGALFLAKYLSEELISKKIQATFLVAAPFTASIHESLGDFVLTAPLIEFEKQAGEIFLYHSTDDDVVPFSDFESYTAALPGAHTRVFKDRGHFHAATLPEIVVDIHALSFQK